MFYRSIVSVLFAITLTCCYADASLDRYGDLGTDYYGFFRRCLAKFLLDEVASHLEGEPVALILKSDSGKIKADEASVVSFEDWTCSAGCQPVELRSKIGHIANVQTELDLNRCKRFTEFDLMFELEQDFEFPAPLTRAIQKWICDTRDTIAIDPREFDRKCENPTTAHYEDAERRLREVFAYDEATFEEVRKALAAEIDAEKREKAAQDEEDLRRISKWVAESIEDHLLTYKRCYATEQALNSSKEEREPKTKGLFKNLFSCFGTGCARKATG